MGVFSCLKEFNIPLTLFKQILATNFPQSLIFLKKVINSWGQIIVKVQFLEVIDETFEENFSTLKVKSDGNFSKKLYFGKFFNTINWRAILLCMYLKNLKIF